MFARLANWPLWGKLVAAFSTIGAVGSGVTFLLIEAPNYVSLFSDKLSVHVESKALPGFNFPGGRDRIDTEAAKGVLPGGADVRLRLVATQQDAKIAVTSIRLDVSLAQKPATEVAYVLDPTKRSGFGVNDRNRIHVALKSATEGKVSFVDGDGKSRTADFPELLPKQRELRLDASAAGGLNEALDVTILPEQPGIYTVRTHITYFDRGKTHEVRSQPVHFIKQ